MSFGQPQRKNTFDQAITGSLSLVKHKMVQAARNSSRCRRGKKVEYRGTLFYDGQSALVVKRWLHRVDDDASGLTFEEWDPTADVDDTQPPAAMIINSSELRGPVFNLKEVLPPELEAAARGLR